MSGGEQDHAPGPAGAPAVAPARRRRRWRLLGWLPDLIVVLLVGSAVANLAFDLDSRWLGLDHAATPAQIPPPAGLDLAAGTPAPPVAASSSGGPVDPAAVRAAVAPYVGDPALGRHVDVAVSMLGSGTVVYRHGSGASTPASTTKLLTTTAALSVLGPATRFDTVVRQSGDRIVLVGGGDPFLASTRAAAKGLYPARATLADLATRTAAALVAQGRTTVSLAYDDSLFTGPRINPAWPATYVPENVVPPIAALWADEGRDGSGHYVADPSRAAAATFARQLAGHGITVAGPVRPGVAADNDPQIAAVRSAPLDQVVEHTLAVSDNNAAEVIGHHVGLAVRDDASFAGGAAAVMQVLGRLGVNLTGSTVHDGSGLSRENRLTADTLLGVLGVASSPEHPELRAVVTGLPVAGFTGSLQWRFDDAPAAARGRVRAKTGTLTGVSGLAGVVTDVEGNRMAFVAIADKVARPQTLAARHDIDLIAAALAACHCSGPTS